MPSTRIRASRAAPRAVRKASRLSGGVLSPELKRFFDAMASHFPGHVMQRLMRPDGTVRYTYVSPGLAALGLDSTAILDAASSTQDWIHPDDAGRWRAALATSAATLEPLDEEVRVIGTDGRVRWVRSIGNPRRLKSGDTVWDGIALDVTEKREALDALRLAKAEADTAEAQKARLLTSLTAILGEPHRTLTDWLATRDAGSAPPDDVLEHLQLAVSAIDRAVALLQGTLAPLSDEAAAATADPRLSALTARQRDVLTLLGVGRSNREIADQLGLTEGTVKLHVGAILRALGVANRTQAAAVAMRPAPHLKHATRA